VFISGLNYWRSISEIIGATTPSSAPIRSCSSASAGNCPAAKPFGANPLGMILWKPRGCSGPIGKSGWAYDLEGSYEEAPQALIETPSVNAAGARAICKHGSSLFAKSLRGVSRMHLNPRYFLATSPARSGSRPRQRRLIYATRIHRPFGYSVEIFQSYLRTGSGHNTAFLIFVICMAVIMLPGNCFRLLTAADWREHPTRSRAFGSTPRAESISESNFGA